jgi:uncharacterized membrane protein YkvA (DUF1232 family)
MDANMDVLQKSLGKVAREYAKDTQKTLQIVKEVTAKAESLDKSGSSAKYLKDIRVLADIVKDWSNGSYYKHVARGSIITIMIGLIHFITPPDSLPEGLPTKFADEGIVLGLVAEQVNEDIEKYRIWKGNGQML